MNKRCLLILVVMVAAVFMLSNVSFAQDVYNGKHYNLNIIGFNKCTKNSATDPNCFNGNAGDIVTSGHTIFVPIKTAQTWAICGTSYVPEVVDLAYLQKGVRILVADNWGTDIQVIDRDATDGTAKLNLPAGSYAIFARALGKPGGCMDIDTIICYDLDTGTTRVDCREDLTANQWVIVGHLDVDRIKGVKPTWINATDQLLPAITGVNTPGYFDFFWQIFNDNLRLLQLRIYEVVAE